MLMVISYILSLCLLPLRNNKRIAEKCNLDQELIHFNRVALDCVFIPVISAELEDNFCPYSSTTAMPVGTKYSCQRKELQQSDKAEKSVKNIRNFSNSLN